VTEFVHADDVGVRQASGGARFALEAARISSASALSSWSWRIVLIATRRSIIGSQAS
jgi:hypothetical protein